LLQRPALFDLRQTATSDLCKRQALPKQSRIPGELPVSCTVFQVQMLRFRNDLTISGRFCWSKTNDLDVESSNKSMFDLVAFRQPLHLNFIIATSSPQFSSSLRNLSISQNAHFSSRLLSFA
jgi:hypothetical protein